MSRPQIQPRKVFLGFIYTWTFKKKKKNKKKKQKDKMWKQTIKSFYYTSSQFENKQTKLQVF